MPSAISITNLTRRFGAVRVLDGIGPAGAANGIQDLYEKVTAVYLLFIIGEYAFISNLRRKK